MNDKIPNTVYFGKLQKGNRYLTDKELKAYMLYYSLPDQKHDPDLDDDGMLFWGYIANGHRLSTKKEED